MSDEGHEDTTRVTLGKIVVSILLLVATALTATLFFITPGTRGFWAVVIALAIAAAGALLIPLRSPK